MRPWTTTTLEHELRLVGLVALHDPLRATASAAVAEARSAGLRVEMVTGDHPITARAIGRALDLPEEAIHARVTPAEKLRLVESLQAEGEVVAVTGDGVNDAPALRRADVGVAMGLAGTEVARESADLVLTDDDFATIVAAIREGRAIADNIRKFVAFLLSANLGEVALFAIAILAGLGVPMTVVQVLLVNILTDGLPGNCAHARSRGTGHDATRARARRPAVSAARVGSARHRRRSRRCRRTRGVPRRPLRRRRRGSDDGLRDGRVRRARARLLAALARPMRPGRHLATSISSAAS